MKQFKGTRGEWDLDEHNDVCVGYELIAYISSSLKNKERRANARLIASAPEMLDMLGKWSILNENEYKDLSGFILRTRELIKKATTI